MPAAVAVFKLQEKNKVLRAAELQQDFMMVGYFAVFLGRKALSGQAIAGQVL